MITVVKLLGNLSDLLVHSLPSLPMQAMCRITIFTDDRGVMAAQPHRPRTPGLK
ncbi:hypothetical protein RMSM_03797 [Rhodopirellula maiorica SM1]|uniref:Uncharacterized protein n=1 Tax=Rhodopirellula maiorica SM1 TaxID=1265738 RepID=M5RJ17_9BACT|nr:hypothetical protein RMSM_03797 [Rhodopirellula maiorica SM1]